MKTTISITVDVEVLAEAKNRLGNLSAFFNEALKEMLKIPEKDLPNDITQLRSIIAGKSAEISELRGALKKAEEKEEAAKPSEVIKSGDFYNKNKQKRKEGIILR